MSEVQALVECPVIVGTAGHVDHGKSALIEALTGKNPDRLEVERRRGMTVELGFGELALPSGKIVGLVDVPGHAHYLRAMVQGATGIDVAVLVVSAVEGVMPQTREHVHVLELLGVTHMVVALTMCDLADAEMTELAELDVDDFLSGTVFAGAPIVPVSSKTGEGIDGLLAVLDEQVGVCWDTCRERAERSDAAPRLPIDRCFTIKGAGTVVWNGPMGVFEFASFNKGTFDMAEAVANCGGVTIIGGGDSASAVEKSGYADKITHISTGGGASLEFLEGLELPGVACLLDK